MTSNMDSNTESLDFPLIVTNASPEEREREVPAHNKDTKSAKLERLRSARLIRCDPRATKLDMQRLQIRQQASITHILGFRRDSSQFKPYKVTTWQQDTRKASETPLVATVRDNDKRVRSGPTFP
jgi:hypothetical protein